MTEPVCVPAGPVAVLDLFDPAQDVGLILPGPGAAASDARGTVLRVGPRRWWLLGPGFADYVPPAGAGAVTPVGGGLARIDLTGADWRARLMELALFDAEAPGFGPGAVAATMIAHADAVVHVVAAEVCSVYVPASLADHCCAHWGHGGVAHNAAGQRT